MLPEWLSWTLTVFLIGLGILGTLLPVLPGIFLILVAGFMHLFPQISPLRLEGSQFFVLTALFFLGVGLEYFFGLLGAKIGGVSRAGLVMGVGGMLVGLFLGPWGILLGPLVGVFVGEVFVAQKTSVAAARATAGYAVGNLTGLIVKVLLALVMAAYLLWSLGRNLPW